MKAVSPEGLDGGRPGAARSAAPAPAVPSLRINSSIPATSKRYKFESESGPVPFGEDGKMVNFKTEKEGRHWIEDDKGLQKRIGAETSRERKCSFALIENIKNFVGRYGREHCAFFTITSPDECHPKEFARRWNSFAANHGQFIVDYGRVLEPQENGRPHYHFVVAVPWDMKPDAFDWEAFFDAKAEFRAHRYSKRHRALTDRYTASSAPETVDLWGSLRRTLKKYKLGRAEILPLRSVAEAIAKYIGHYLEAGLKLRKDEWKGCRRVEWARRSDLRRIKVNCFAFANFTLNPKTGVYGTGGPRRKWREHCDALLAAVGGRVEEDMEILLGKKWQYRYRTQLMATDEAFSSWLRDAVPVLVRRFEGLPFTLARHDRKSPPRAYPMEYRPSASSTPRQEYVQVHRPDSPAMVAVAKHYEELAAARIAPLRENPDFSAEMILDLEDCDVSRGPEPAYTVQCDPNIPF